MSGERLSGFMVGVLVFFGVLMGAEAAWSPAEMPWWVRAPEIIWIAVVACLIGARG